MSAVTAGAAFLDERDPEWWREDVERAVDLDRLDLVSPNLCVLGQRCPLEALVSGQPTPYAAQARRLAGIDATDPVDLWEGGVKLGFAIGDEHESYLTAEWKRLITERRSA